MKELRPPKYYASIALNFVSYDRFLFRFADRNEAEVLKSETLERIRNCMIYLICIRPIITLVPKSIKVIGENLECTIKYRINGNEQESFVKFPLGALKKLKGEIKVSDYPHTSIDFYDNDGNKVVNLLLANMVHLFEGLPPEITDLEVLYVGKGTADCAVDRLNGHSTLEKILADILRNEPNKEVAILIHNFKMKRQPMIIKSIGEKAEIRGKEADKRNSKALEYNPSLDEQSKLAEALLIDYFKTDKYNSHFTKGLELHRKIFRNVLKIDFDAIIVELNNENIGNLKIYSKVTESNYFHHVILDFRKLEGRVSIFDLENVKQST